MVISQLHFRKYLDGQDDPTHAAACAFFPRPDTTSRQYRNGDFDVLIIHRSYGLIVGEVKSVGADPHAIPNLDEAVVSRVEKAVKQLNKSQVVLNHLVSDMQWPVRITKVLILPNITSVELQQALKTSTTVSQVSLL